MSWVLVGVRVEPAKHCLFGELSKTRNQTSAALCKRYKNALQVITNTYSGF